MPPMHRRAAEVIRTIVASQCDVCLNPKPSGLQRGWRLLSGVRAYSLEPVERAAQQEFRAMGDGNSGEPAASLDQRVDEAGMPIRRQQLQRFQRERAADDDGNDQEQPAGIATHECKSHQRERCEMFELGTCDDRTISKRGKRRKDDEGEHQPGANQGQSLVHRLLLGKNRAELNPCRTAAARMAALSADIVNPAAVQPAQICYQAAEMNKK
jgi:hypothetical protein